MTIKGKTILLTGGAGFIGSHLAENLLEQGASVIIYDNFKFGSEENITHLKGDINIIRGDILDHALLSKSMKNVDFISHHAAELEILKANSIPEHDLEVNTVGTLNILKAAADNKVKKIINASSACIYGQPISPLQDESHPQNPNWTYGVSKLAAEKYCQIFMNTTHIPVVSIRYGIVYGPREWYRRALTIFVKRVAEGEPPVIFGTGEQYRDYVSVHDIVKLNLLALTNEKANGQAYNGGTGVKTTIKDLAEAAISASGNTLEIIYEQVGEGETSKLVPGKRRNISDLGGMCLSSDKAKRELNWEPKVSLKAGLSESIEWYKNNKHRWVKLSYSD